MNEWMNGEWMNGIGIEWNNGIGIEWNNEMKGMKYTYKLNE